MERLRSSAKGLIDRLPEDWSRRIKGLPPLVSPNNHLANAYFPWLEKMVIAEEKRKAETVTEKPITTSSS
jgi:hypothetical protein